MKTNITGEEELRKISKEEVEEILKSDNETTAYGCGSGSGSGSGSGCGCGSGSGSGDGGDGSGSGSGTGDKEPKSDKYGSGSFIVGSTKVGADGFSISVTATLYYNVRITYDKDDKETVSTSGKLVIKGEGSSSSQSGVTYSAGDFESEEEVTGLENVIIRNISFRTSGRRKSPLSDRAYTIEGEVNISCSCYRQDVSVILSSGLVSQASCNAYY